MFSFWRNASCRQLVGNKRALTTMTADPIIATRLWVERFVYKQGLCPWAGSVLPKPYMKIDLLSGNSNNDASLLRICDRVMVEATQLSKIDSVEKTTLLVLPEYKQFESFLELIDVIDQLLDSEGLDEHVQCAHFHPDYQFADSDYDSVENYTNRSPFPVLHLLKVKDVAKGIEDYGEDTSAIWTRNKETMRSLGMKKLRQINAAILKDAQGTQS